MTVPSKDGTDSAMVVFGDFDVVRLPAELGGGERRVLSRHRDACPHPHHGEDVRVHVLGEHQGGTLLLFECHRSGWTFARLGPAR